MGNTISMGDPPGWLPHYPSFLNVQAALREVNECIAGLLGEDIEARTVISLPEWSYQYSNGIHFRDHTSGIVLGGACCTVSQTTYSEEKIVECLEEATGAACLMAALIQGIAPSVLLYLMRRRTCNRHDNCNEADAQMRKLGYATGAWHASIEEERIIDRWLKRPGARQ